jgi:hypothetical protein
VPQYAFWIDDTQAVVSRLEDPPDVGDHVSLEGRGRFVVTIERPNHDPAVAAAYTVERDSSDSA